MKDRNGKELQEGDVCVTDEGEIVEFIWESIFSRGLAFVCGGFDSWIMAEKLEIIGDIR